jgi:hypothetical protein
VLPWKIAYGAPLELIWLENKDPRIKKLYNAWDIYVAGFFLFKIDFFFFFLFFFKKNFVSKLSLLIFLNIELIENLTM